MYPPNLIVRICGQYTNSGGGGTKLELFRVLKSRNITATHCIIDTCSLHNVHACLWNAVLNMLGEERRDKINEPVANVMQMMHSVYNLQNWQENEELKQLWSYL